MIRRRRIDTGGYERILDSIVFLLLVLFLGRFSIQTGCFDWRNSPGW